MVSPSVAHFEQRSTRVAHYPVQFAGEETDVPMEVIPEQVKIAAKEHVESLKREQTRLMEMEEEYGIRLSPTYPESSQNNYLNNKAFFQRVIFRVQFRPKCAACFVCSSEEV